MDQKTAIWCGRSQRQNQTIHNCLASTHSLCESPTAPGRISHRQACNTESCATKHYMTRTTSHHSEVPWSFSRPRKHQPDQWFFCRACLWCRQQGCLSVQKMT